MTAVAVVGLGNMGAPMAANLVTAGHRVRGFDLSETARTAGKSAGVEIADSVLDAVRDAEVVITMLPAGEPVLQTYAEIVPAVAAGTLLIDCSTIDVASSRAAHEVATGAGLRSVDAPVSGGVVGAEAGTLTFMAGGDADAVGAAEPLLEVLGKRTVHCGGPGAGQAAKICNNLILGVSMGAVCEAFVLGESLGLDPQALFDVASTASGQCWALTTNCPVPGPVPTSPANRDYAGGFAGALMVKDLGLAMTAARAQGVVTDFGRTAAEVYAAFAEGGGGGRDFSAVITDIRDRSQEKT